MPTPSQVRKVDVVQAAHILDSLDVVINLAWRAAQMIAGEMPELSKADILNQLHLIEITTGELCDFVRSIPDNVEGL